MQYHPSAAETFPHYAHNTDILTVNKEFQRPTHIQI